MAVSAASVLFPARHMVLITFENWPALLEFRIQGHCRSLPDANRLNRRLALRSQSIRRAACDNFTMTVLYRPHERETSRVRMNMPFVEKIMAAAQKISASVASS